MRFMLLAGFAAIAASAINPANAGGNLNTARPPAPSAPAKSATTLGGQIGHGRAITNGGTNRVFPNEVNRKQ